jgi:hypothetical protein
MLLLSCCRCTEQLFLGENGGTVPARSSPNRPGVDGVGRRCPLYSVMPVSGGRGRAGQLRKAFRCERESLDWITGRMRSSSLSGFMAGVSRPNARGKRLALASPAGVRACVLYMASFLSRVRPAKEHSYESWYRAHLRGRKPLCGGNRRIGIISKLEKIRPLPTV